MTIPFDTHNLVRLAAAFVAAGMIAWAAYFLINTVRLEHTASKHLNDFRSEKPQDNRQAALGEQVLGALPISLSEWENHLEWAQRGGFYPGKRLGNIVFSGLLYAAAGAVFFLFNPAPVMLALPLIAFVFPFIGMRSKANKVRKRATRSLPEMAALVAAEIAAGTPADQAVLRAGQLPGPLSDLLNEAVSFSRQTGRPLFSRKPVRGALGEVFSRTGMPALRSFALQLDEIAGKGIDAPELMNETARSLAREFRERMMTEKELLGGKLTRHVAFHFFFPEVLIILAAFFIPLIELMTG